LRYNCAFVGNSTKLKKKNETSSIYVSWRNTQRISVAKTVGLQQIRE